MKYSVTEAKPESFRHVSIQVTFETKAELEQFLTTLRGGCGQARLYQELLEKKAEIERR